MSESANHQAHNLQNGSMATSRALINHDRPMRSPDLLNMSPSTQTLSASPPNHDQDSDMAKDNRSHRWSGTTLVSTSVNVEWTPHLEFNAYVNLTGKELPSEWLRQRSRTLVSNPRLAFTPRHDNVIIDVEDGDNGFNGGRTPGFDLLDTSLGADAEVTLRAGYAARVRRGYLGSPRRPASGLIIWPTSPEPRVGHLGPPDPVTPSQHKTPGKSKGKMKGLLHSIFRFGKT